MPRADTSTLKSPATIFGSAALDTTEKPTLIARISGTELIGSNRRSQAMEALSENGHTRPQLMSARSANCSATTAGPPASCKHLTETQ